MLYFYVKALHIIFIVTWFSGMFYIVRLFIYNTEAGGKSAVEKEILQRQFTIMIRRLWLGITWPSAILTIIFGVWMISFYDHIPSWLWIKLGFVAGLYAYHISLQKIYTDQVKGRFRYSSGHLRIWNEVATIFLIVIIMLATVKENMSWIYGIIGMVLLMILLMSAIRIYKMIRSKKTNR